MNVDDRIQKAMSSLQQAESELNRDNKRLALGLLDYVQDYVIAAKYLLLAEISEDEEIQ